MKTGIKSTDLLVKCHISSSLQMVFEIKRMHEAKFCCTENAKNASWKGAKGNKVSLIIDTDAKVITLRCYYLYVTMGVRLH